MYQAIVSLIKPLVWLHSLVAVAVMEFITIEMRKPVRGGGAFEMLLIREENKFLEVNAQCEIKKKCEMRDKSAKCETKLECEMRDKNARCEIKKMPDAR